MIRILQVSIVILCAWDAAFTQYLINHHLTDEGNPLMANVIDVYGWPLTWVIKLGLGFVFAYAVPGLIKSKLGKILMGLVYGSYLIIAVSHPILVFICKK